MANYSKWDKYVKDLSDSEDEERIQKPKVIQFDKKAGESITIGPEGYSIGKSQTKTTNDVKVDDTTEESNMRINNNNIMSSAGLETNNILSNLTRNGAMCDGYLWRQDRYQSVVLIALPVDINTKSLTVDYNTDNKIISIQHSNSETNDNNRIIKNNIINRQTILERVLKYDIIINDLNNDSFVIDWEIINLSIDQSILIKSHMSKNNNINDNNNDINSIGYKFIELTLRKKSLIPNAIIWWNCLFAGDEELDVASFPDRQQNNNINNLNRSVWEEAHKAFQQRVAEREIIEIDN
eukprot:gene13776-18479_t